MDTENDAEVLTPLSELLSKGRNDASAPVADVVETPERAAPAVEPTPEAAAPVDQPKGDAQTATPAADDDPSQWTKPAYLAEKTKRQEAETRARELEAELARLKAPAQERPQPETLDPLTTDPKVYAFRTRAQHSEMILRAMPDKYPNYEEVVTIYAEAAKRGEAPMPGWDHPNPAQFAYEQGQKIKAMAEIGDPATYKQRIRDEALAEQAQKAEAERAKLAAAVMPTAAGDRSAAPREGSDGWEPESAKDILGKRKRA